MKCEFCGGDSIYRVGVYIDDEFIEFSTCTEERYAEVAKALLEKAGWEDTEIIKSNLFLNSITIDDREYDLTTYTTNKTEV